MLRTRRSHFFECRQDLFIFSLQAAQVNKTRMLSLAVYRGSLEQLDGAVRRGRSGLQPITDMFSLRCFTTAQLPAALLLGFRECASGLGDRADTRHRSVLTDRAVWLAHTSHDKKKPACFLTSFSFLITESFVFFVPFGGFRRA